MLTINFDLTEFESVEVITIADVHLGNELCQEGLLKETIDYILQEPDDPKMARVCILNGDLTESVTKNTRAGNIFQQTMTPSVQVATMIKYLLPLTETSKKYPMGKIVSYCAGNHDEGRYKETGISAAESIAVGLGLEDRFSVNGCYNFFKLKRRGDNKNFCYCSLYNTHMTGGGSTVGGKANRVAKISNGVIADVIVGSHVHLPMTFKEDIILPASYGTLAQKTITYLITGAFLSYGDYAQRSGFKPATILMPKLFIKQGRFKGKEECRYIYTEVLL